MRGRPSSAAFLAFVGALLLGPGIVPSQAQPRAEARAADNMPLDDYLALLERISPAARDGAQAYLQSVQQRCGRTLTTAQLRRAVAQGDGDPVLMGMIRSSQLRDGTSIRQLAQRIACKPRSDQ